MNWQEYFDDAKGHGYLATAGADGDVNIAVYARPKVLRDGTLAFGMTDRLTHANLAQNPKAVYAFRETGFRGVRIYLEKVREEQGGPVLEEIRRRANEIVGPDAAKSIEYLVSFKVLRYLNFVGGEEPKE